MRRIPREVVEAVRERTDIAAVVQRHVALKRAGKDWKGLCPFHQEKTPSFHVIPHKGIYHCFGCQAGGDVFRFLMEISGVSFAEAVKELAASAGVEVPERELTLDERRRMRARADLYEVVQSAADHFTSNLWTTEHGQVAREYLKERGISDELARSAGLGWAPPRWDSLSRHLESQGYPARLAVTAGLLRQKDDRVYDFYRERIVFPIRDERLRVIGFGGRTLSSDPKEAKYVNSSESPLYHKKKVLYGLDMARKTIVRRGRAILVEGYFDVLSLHQAGFEEAIAVCGTALTPEHAEKLRRLMDRTTSKLIVVTDADSAGMKAAMKMLPTLMEVGIASFRLDVPGAKDPDELIRKEGPEAMGTALEKNTTSLLTWVARQNLKTHGHDAAGKQRILETMGAALGHLTPPEASELAAVLRMDERTVLQRVRTAAQKIKVPAHQEAAAAAAPAPGWKPNRDVVHLLWLLAHRYGETADLIMRADPALLDGHPVVRPAVARLLQAESLSSVLDAEEDNGVRRTLSAVAARATLYTTDEAALAACQVLTRLARPMREARMAELKWRMTADARSGRNEEARAAVTELKELTSLQRTLDKALLRGDVVLAASLLGPPRESDDETSLEHTPDTPASNPQQYHTGPNSPENAGEE